MHKQEPENSWLEPVLRRHLTRASAPDNLWDHIVLPRVERPSRSHLGFFWTVAAASALAASVIAVAWAAYPHAGRSFDSGQVTEARAWIRSRTGLDIPFLAPANPSIRIVSARVIEGTEPAVEVRYQAANEDAVLLVSKSYRDNDLSGKSLRNTRSVSWIMAGQAYSLAVRRSENLHEACLVCHTDSTVQMAWN